MRKLSEYLNPEDDLDFGNKFDVVRLKEEIPELAHVANQMVARMYADYSDMYAAGWLTLDEDTIESFKRWLL